MKGPKMTLKSSAYAEMSETDLDCGDSYRNSRPFWKASFWIRVLLVGHFVLQAGLLVAQDGDSWEGISGTWLTKEELKKLKAGSSKTNSGANASAMRESPARSAAMPDTASDEIAFDRAYSTFAENGSFFGQCGSVEPSPRLKEMIEREREFYFDPNWLFSWKFKREEWHFQGDRKTIFVTGYYREETHNWGANAETRLDKQSSWMGRISWRQDMRTTTYTQQAIDIYTDEDVKANHPLPRAQYFFESQPVIQRFGKSYVRSHYRSPAAPEDLNPVLRATDLKTHSLAVTELHVSLTKELSKMRETWDIAEKEAKRSGRPQELLELAELVLMVKGYLAQLEDAGEWIDHEKREMAAEETNSSGTR